MRKADSLLLAAIIVLMSFFQGSAGYNSSLERGLRQLQAQQYDSAQVSLYVAFKDGMSKDSLYYMWANLYIQKGVYDSALALNAALIDTASIWQNRTLNQRYLIYKMLGWEDDASGLLVWCL
jgi:hypothetical protein